MLYSSTKGHQKQHTCTNHPEDFKLPAAVWFTSLFCSFRQGFAVAHGFSRNLKCATLLCSLVVCASVCVSLSLCIQFTARQAHTANQPAVLWDTKSPASKLLLPLESHAFTPHPTRSTLLCVPSSSLQSCSALNHMIPLGPTSLTPAHK